MNWRPILTVLARLLAFVVVAEAMTIWEFWRSSWTPIERHYLPAYIWCSLPIASPSTVEVQWIWKIGRHQKQQLARDDDAVDSADGTGMALSQSALDVGWKTLIEAPPQQFPTELLKPDLARLAFEDQSFWDLFLLPESSAVVVLCVALGTWFLLIRFLRGLIGEYAWRRRLSSRQELLPMLSKDCAVLARRVRSGLEALYQSAMRRIEMQRAAASTNIDQSRPPTRRASFPFPLFGVCNGTGEGHLWRERDQID
jgi:hypothetical protein